MESYSAIKTPFVETWMSLQVTILSEVSQIEKEKHTISLICGI